MSTTQIVTKKDQYNEIIKCGQEPVYFINKYIKIQHPKKGLIKFETYPFQDECVKAFNEHRFNILLKSRQLGLSTVTAAYAVWMALFHKDKNILIIATKLSTAINFIKKVKVALDNIPKWMLLTSYEPTKQKITFSNGSTITAIPTSPDAGRSEALSLLVVDEAAFIRDFEEIWTGLSPTISTGGSAIIISTPNGVGGQYYRLWTEAENKSNEFNPIRLMWQVHPEHDQDWFDRETKNLPKRLIGQEFLCDFVSSGETFLQPEQLDYLRNMIMPPVEKSGPGGSLWVWEPPRMGCKYVISADVARGDAADYSTFHVIKHDTLEVVAEYMGKMPVDRFANFLAEHGEQYNNALICPEQNTFGYFACTALKSMNYKNLYYDDREDLFGEVNNYDPGQKLPGFSTQTKSRQQILVKLEELIRNERVVIRSQRTYDQLQAFVYKNGRAQASADAHDDLVMSLAIGTWITAGRTQQVTKEEPGLGDEDKIALLKATKVYKRDTTSFEMFKSPTFRTQQRTTTYRSQNNQSKNVVLNEFLWLYK